MNAPDTQPALWQRIRESQRAQVVGTALASVLICSLIVGLHLHQRRTLAVASAAVTNFRQARLDLAHGFAHLTGSGAAGSPFDRNQGYALLRQAVNDFDDLAYVPATTDPALAGEFRAEVATFRNGLEALIKQPDAAKSAVEIRVAFHRLETLAGTLDAESQVNLQKVAHGQDTAFAGVLAAASCLLAVILCFVYLVGRSVRSAEVARGLAEEGRLESENRERRTAELLRAVADQTTDAVFIKDRSGRYLLFNPAAARLVGREVDEVIGRDDTHLFDTASARAVIETDQRIMADEQATTEEEQLTAGGVTRTYLATKAPFHDERGQVIGVIGIARDISERKKLDEQLRQSQKMEAVGRLAGGVAHDFNNLLTVINSYVELLLLGKHNSAKHDEFLRAIQDAGLRATALTAQLLAFGRKALVRPKEVDPRLFILRSEGLLRRLIGEDVIMETQLPASIGKVSIDPSQLDQVLLNLAVNARDAMPGGGRLVLAAHEIQVPVTGAAGASNGRFIEISVSDSGCGISDEVKARIFEPFFTTRAPGQGTGLGLSVVLGIIEQAGGHILVESSVGLGTTFRVRLPTIAQTTGAADAVEAAEAAESPRPARDDAPPAGETVLLAEDDEHVRRIAAIALQTRGYTVLEAATGSAAMAACRERSIDILVTDMVMPGMSGRELASELRTRFPGLRVLFLSGYTEDEIVRRGIREGGDAFLPKPFTPDELAHKVRSVLHGGG